MGYVNDKVFVPPLPVDLEELKQHKTATIHGLDSDTLTRVWVELDYRLNWFSHKNSRGRPSTDNQPSQQSIRLHLLNLERPNSDVLQKHQTGRASRITKYLPPPAY
ncbi:hypothetical protein NPIL_484622 [Nephila pilipes]|uniref:Uncharacterized protein n=1 Tax=Nephila pilipes TaxID=299642 RepID=A0A8X6PUY8_NEPPI|nr:hypothetical protein NPIL_484622 [Nephila pilipes]